MQLPEYNRGQLALYTMQELKSAASKYELEPLGRAADRNSWINALTAFQGVATRQLANGAGLNKDAEPSELLYRCGCVLQDALDRIGEPTPEQLALVRAFLIHQEEPTSADTRDAQKALVRLFVARDLIAKALRAVKNEKRYN